MSTPELYFEECSECKKKFHSNVELKVHMKLMHPKIDEFNCNICDKKFKRKWNLRSHLNFVHGVQENKGIFFTFNKMFQNRSKLQQIFQSVCTYYHDENLFLRPLGKRSLRSKICETKFGICCRIS